MSLIEELNQDRTFVPSSVPAAVMLFTKLNTQAGVAPSSAVLGRDRGETPVC